MTNSVKSFPMNKVKKNPGSKRKINFQEALHLEKRKIKLMKERLLKKSHSDEDFALEYKKLV
jgi:hypothetical protein